MPREPYTRLPQPLFDEPTFNEGKQTKDPTKFKTPHPSDDAQYAKIEDLLTKDAVSFDASRLPPDGLYTLVEALGPHGADEVAAITKAGHIIFQAFGDSGASSARNYSSELHVSDQVTHDYHSSSVASRPSFLYHLGDIIYNFGESKYYYDQFYEPYRNYPAPIFAIPGNHDSFITLCPTYSIKRYRKLLITLVLVTSASACTSFFSFFRCFFFIFFFNVCVCA